MSDVVSVIAAAKDVVLFSSQVQEIEEITSPTSHSYRCVGYFVPSEKMEVLRESLLGLEQVAAEARAKLDQIKADMREVK